MSDVGSLTPGSRLVTGLGTRPLGPALSPGLPWSMSSPHLAPWLLLSMQTLRWCQSLLGWTHPAVPGCIPPVTPAPSYQQRTRLPALCVWPGRSAACVRGQGGVFIGILGSHSSPR